MQSDTLPTQPNRNSADPRPDVDAPAPVGETFRSPRSTAASRVFDLLDPIPYGCFVGAFVFDAVYARTGEVLWVKAAAWLIVLGLIVAIVPRLIDLARVWFPRARPRAGSEMAGFWLNLLAVAAAVLNALVHSRDAYGAMPEGLWLSGLTVALLMLAKVTSTVRQPVVRAW